MRQLSWAAPHRGAQQRTGHHARSYVKAMKEPYLAIPSSHAATAAMSEHRREPPAILTYMASSPAVRAAYRSRRYCNIHDLCVRISLNQDSRPIAESERESDDHQATHVWPGFSSALPSYGEQHASRERGSGCRAAREARKHALSMRLATADRAAGLRERRGSMR